MPTLAIVSAMQEELRALLPLLDEPKRLRLAGREFHAGLMHGHPVVLVRSGIGKVAAATTAALLIEAFDAERLVLTGVAGGIGDGVRIGDVVVANELLQHDMDASPIFARHEVPGHGRARFPTDGGWSERLARACEATLHDPRAALGEAAVDTFSLQAPRVHQGLLVSGDRFVSRTVESQALQAELPDALAVDMESAAAAQVIATPGQ